MGAGNTKNRRGAGGRGGRGKAGTNKHRFHSAGRLKPTLYRQKILSVKGKAIKLGELNAKLDALVAKGLVTKENDKYVVTKKSKFAKVLTQGEVTHKIILKINASSGAVKKIIAAGGKFDYAKKGVKVEEEIKFSGDEADEDLEFESEEGEKA